MRHILFIDPIEKLNIKKDSSLMIGLSLMNQGDEVYLLFEKDFAVFTKEQTVLTVYEYSGSYKEEGFYLKEIKLGESRKLILGEADILHMRIDPPYDSRYQRYLWMLDFLEEKSKVKVVNKPLGIMKHNEKLAAFKRSKSLESFIGSSVTGFAEFIGSLKKKGVKNLILKPLDLYSGIGVEKISIDDEKLISRFESKVLEFEGAIITQPFQDEVYNGEIRSLYLNGKEIGSIIKKPVDGDFLANIAQGAEFRSIELSDDLKEECDLIAKEMMTDGVSFLAYDILAGAVTEVNVTCPGLLVEVSYALEKNIADIYAASFRV
jgi:glutathione synthase